MIGNLDQTILDAIRAGRPLTPVERDSIAVRHTARTGGGSDRGLRCRACGFRYGKCGNPCPSLVFLADGLRAALAVLPPPTQSRRCRSCGVGVQVQRGARGSVQCQSCEFQPSLFGDAS